MVKRQSVGGAPSSSRIRIGAQIDEMLYCRLKVHAADDGNTISAAIEEAVKAHLSSGEPDVEERTAAFSGLTSEPFRLSDGQLREIMEIMEEDVL